METKIQKEFIDNGFGFPVKLLNVPMVKVRGHWTPKVNYNILADTVLLILTTKRSRLSGHEIKFIRTYFEMTLEEFGVRFGVTHVAVLKWEKPGDGSTSMNWSTEKDIRLFILDRLKSKPDEVGRLYISLSEFTELAAAFTKNKLQPISVDVAKLAA